MTADSRLGEEKSISGPGETSQISNTAESFQMPKFNLQWLSFHDAQNIKVLSIELQAEI